MRLPPLCVSFHYTPTRALVNRVMATMAQQLRTVTIDPSSDAIGAMYSPAS
jgi:hypothetical protein